MTYQGKSSMATDVKDKPSADFAFKIDIICGNLTPILPAMIASPSAFDTVALKSFQLKP